MNSHAIHGQAKSLVLFSGGLDSTTCVHFLQSQNFSVTGLFVDFGQLSATMERRAIQKVREHLRISVETIKIDGFNAQTSGELPNRNLLLLSAALFFAGRSSCVIAMGIHAGTTYYDCSQEFLDSVNTLAKAQSDGRISVTAPFASWSKRDIYDYASHRNLPIGETYSCEQGTSPVCGICASCRDRKALNC